MRTTLGVRLEDDLVRQHRELAYRCATGFFLPGQDRDDVRQEALIGLLAAVRGYRPDMGVPFEQWARVVIRRRLMVKVTAARRLRARMLTDAARDTVEFAAGPADVADRAEHRDQLRRIVACLPSLTELERQALAHAVNGRSYAVRGSRDGSIDNALQRARRKLRAA